MNNPNQGWKSRQKRTAAQAQLKVVGFLLILMVVFGAVSVSAIQDPPGDPWRLGNESLFTWQVLSSTKQGVQCTLVIDHSGAPSEDEILLSCDRATSAAWGESQACVSMIAYGQDHECEGLYLQWVGSQPYSPFASIILDDPMWGIVPGEEKLPTWLVQPDNVQELASDRPLTLLAGNLITKQFVNANGCPGHGLLPNGAANACGEIVARPAVTDWQNQFDSIIYGAALQTKVPAQLLKNIFIQETQFWPASSRESANTEHGFGHMTQNGADTLLMWNKVFFDNFCPTVLSEYSCLVGYFMMPSEQQALLRGAVLEAVDADCPTCMAAIDFEKAAASIPIFAHALAANGNQVEQMIFNLTGKPAAGLVSYEDLWKFTAANYNAGPWCLNVSFNQTLRVGEYLRWKRIATHFPEACEGVLGYVKNVTQFDVPEEASEDLVNNPLTPTPVSTPTAPVVAAANQPYTTLPTASSPPSQTTEILVQFRPVLSLFSGFAIRAAQGEKIEDLDGMRNIVISVPATQFAEALKELQGSWLVAYAEPNAIVQAAGRQVSHNSGAAFSGHFGAAQAQTLSDPRVIVAVIDSGIDIQHAELKASIWINGGEDYTDNQGDDLRSNNVDDDDNGYVDDWVGWNFVDGGNDVTDLYGHGTHTAGIIITESAGKAAVLPVKALNAFGYGTYAGAAEAIIYAVDQGASIIHLGFGGLEASRTLQEAVDYAYENGALVISAAGNSGDGTLWYPAVLPRVIAAAAVDNQNLRAAFSSYGEHLSLAAPGVDILSTYPGGGTTSMSGTSMSAAAISGTAAQLASLPQFDSPDKIRAALQNTALDLGSTGKDEYYGFGLVQPDAALAYLISATPTPEPWVTVALTPAGDGIGAMALEQLFGSAQTCSYGTISTPANSIDLAFNDATAACAGPVAPGGSWEYTAIQDTLLSSVASASLDVRFFMSGLSNDTITLEVSKNNG
ncbi:MAG: S8 family serine peptidase, partial [Chloroflexota bacterium]